MLASGLPLHVVALTAPGHYDTHSNQAGDLAQGLQLTTDSLLAFQRDLETRGLADRVLVHVWSEFGRRAQENGDAGTDHGAAGVGFLIGSRAKGQMVGEFPGLQNGLDADGNVKATADFRGVYASLLEQWLGVDAGLVIPNAALVLADDARPVIAAPPPPARVQVVAQEFRYALSRQTIKAGPAIIELRNAGEDAHDLLSPARRRHARLRVPADAVRPDGRPAVHAPARHLPPLLRRREPPRARDAGDARRTRR